MTARLVPLYERLPEIHRTRDVETEKPDQLRAYLGLIDEAFSAIHDDIWRLYDDLFVETASDWAIPYIGDLLGTTHLSGDPWTMRADVADTIALRRRKGTLAAIELLTFDLTAWGVHAVELRDRLVWSQHLNHIRPDRGEFAGVEPPGRRLVAPQRGGTVTLRDPALLSLIGSPFDPFAHLPDVRPPDCDTIRYNLPNLAVFLWRLTTYGFRVATPGSVTIRQPATPTAGVQDAAKRIVAVDLDPLGRPVRLFQAGSRSRSRGVGCCEDGPPAETVSLSQLDDAPGPILPARLTQDSPAGNPGAYVRVETYDPDHPENTLETDTDALTLHLPQPTFLNAEWRFRGSDLRAWDACLDDPLGEREIAIDPLIGRLLVGVKSVAEANAVVKHLLVTYTYGAPGPVGAHPIDREAAPAAWDGDPIGETRIVGDADHPLTLQDALADLQKLDQPLVIEIDDSLVHEVDLDAVTGRIQDPDPTLIPGRTVILRAGDGARPIVRLKQPLRVRPTQVRTTPKAAQEQLDVLNSHLALRLEGLFLTRAEGFPAGEPLIARVALNRLEIVDCTLDPGGYRQVDGSRAALEPAIALTTGHGFTGADATAFRETPVIAITRSIVGSIAADDGDYTIDVIDSIVDAGSGPNEPAGGPAVSAATNPSTAWGAPLCAERSTFLGPIRVEEINATGVIFAHALQVHNDQTGCVRLSALAGVEDRLPQNVESVRGPEVRPRFTSISLGDPAYAQLTRTTDIRIRERGPGDDEMGAWNSHREAHKWRNLQVRYREFMPLGIRPLLIPVT